MEVRAAVAEGPGRPLRVETVRVEGPREGEVMVELKATGLCHTDAFTLSGRDPEGDFPAISGTRARASWWRRARACAGSGRATP